MITTLLRQDPAMAYFALVFRFVFPLSFVVITWWATLSSHAQAGGPEDFGLHPTFTMSAMLLWLATHGPMGQGRIRVFEYQLSLPISARKLVGLRLAVHLLPGLALFAIVLVLASPSGSIGSPLDLHAAALCSAWAVSILSLFAWQPNRPRIDSSRVYALLTILGTSVLALPFFAPRLALLLTLPSGAWLVIHLWRRVPQTMCLAEDQLSSGSPPGESTPGESTPGGSTPAATRERAGSLAGSLNVWIARRAIFRPRFLLFAPAAFFFPMSVQWDIGFTLLYLPMTVYFTVALLQSLAGILRDFGHLPISRRTLAAWILLPSAIIFLAGTFAGHTLGGSWSTSELRREVSLSFRPPDKEFWRTRETWHLQVPGELLRFHWGKEPILIEAPWGETATIEPKSLFWGFPLRLINPYDVELEKNSAEFIAWQFSRAVQDAYGITVAPETLQARFMIESMTGKRFRRYRLGWDYPDAKARSYPGGRLAVGLCLSTLLWALALLALTAVRLPPRDRARWKWRVAARTTLGVLVVGFLGAIYIFGMTHGQIHAKLRSTMEGPMELWITSHPWVSAILSLAALVAIYRLAMRQIERMESPMPHPVLDAERSDGVGS